MTENPSHLDLVSHFHAMARNNAWSNRRLLSECQSLTADEFVAPRTGFFPSLCGTLNHILTVDWYYIDALHAGGRGIQVFEPEVPFINCESLTNAQLISDQQLVCFCDALNPEALNRSIILDRGQRGRMLESCYAVLAHLFVHQIHHRGQAHAMLAGTHRKPPQLDEFFLAEDSASRDSDLKAMHMPF